MGERRTQGCSEKSLSFSCSSRTKVSEALSERRRNRLIVPNGGVKSYAEKSDICAKFGTNNLGLRFAAQKSSTQISLSRA